LTSELGPRGRRPAGAHASLVAQRGGPVLIGRDLPFQVFADAITDEFRDAISADEETAAQLAALFPGRAGRSGRSYR
jgi:hypothetical protein